MDLDVNLGKNYKWKFDIDDSHSKLGFKKLKVNLSLIPVSDLYEHEAVIDNISNSEHQAVYKFVQV